MAKTEHLAAPLANGNRTESHDRIPRIGDHVRQCSPPGHVDFAIHVQDNRRISVDSADSGFGVGHSELRSGSAQENESGVIGQPTTGAEVADLFE